MAITKLPSGNYQVKIVGTDKKWLTETFSTKWEAVEQEEAWKKQKRGGEAVSASAGRVTLDEFFKHWEINVPRNSSSKWKKDQSKLYWKYVSLLIGAKQIKTLNPIHVGTVFQGTELNKKSAAVKRHVFILLRRLFQDAIEIYRLLTFNPVLRKFKPDVPMKEAPHLNVEDLKTLLKWVWGKPYGTAVWLQLYLGLRVGETIALKWEDIDLVSGIAAIRRTFVKSEWQFKDYPKGKKQHSHRIPEELQRLLGTLDRNSEFVATSPEGGMVTYKLYLKHLKQYCKEVGIRKIGTHGLRHSTSGIYIDHGATRDDLQRLFAHSSMSVTDRYIHHRNSNLEKVAKVIQLFPRNFHEAGFGENNNSSKTKLSNGNENGK